MISKDSYDLRSSTCTASPLFRKVIRKILKKYRISFDEEEFSYTFSEENECMANVEGILLGYVRNDLDLDEDHFNDFESDEDELEDNLCREHQNLIKRDHRSSAVRKDTVFRPEKRQKLSIHNRFTDEELDAKYAKYKSFMDEQELLGKTAGAKTRFANLYYRKNVNELDQVIKAATDQGKDYYKYQKVYEFVFEKFEIARFNLSQVTNLDWERGLLKLFKYISQRNNWTVIHSCTI